MMHPLTRDWTVEGCISLKDALMVVMSSEVMVLEDFDVVLLVEGIGDG